MFWLQGVQGPTFRLMLKMKNKNQKIAKKDCCKSITSFT